MLGSRSLRVRCTAALVLLACVLYLWQTAAQVPTTATRFRKPGIRARDLHIFQQNAINNTVVVVPVNSGMMHFTDNLLCSLEQADFNTSSIVFWALDDGAAETLHDRGFAMYRDRSLWSTSKDANNNGNTAEYQKMMRQRPLFYVDVLASGFDLLMIDVDIVFWQSPLAIVPQGADRDTISIVYTTDAREFYTEHDAFADDYRRGSLMPPVCNGMFWMKSTRDTISIWQEMLLIFEAPWWRMGLFRSWYFQDDQRGVDVLLNDGRAELVAPFPEGITADMVPNAGGQARLKVRLVDQAMAINGHLLLDRRETYDRSLAKLRETGRDRLMAHMNWNTEFTTKLDGAKKTGLYFLNEHGKCAKQLP